MQEIIPPILITPTASRNIAAYMVLVKALLKFNIITFNDWCDLYRAIKRQGCENHK